MRQQHYKSKAEMWICASHSYFQLYEDLWHHATVLCINVWLVGDRLFGAPSKSVPGARAPLALPKGQHWSIEYGHEFIFCSKEQLKIW
jgi:hypothetical protein